MVQEIVLSKAITIHCGDDTSAWELLIDARMDEAIYMSSNIDKYYNHTVADAISRSIFRLMHLAASRSHCYSMPKSLTGGLSEEENVLDLFTFHSDTVCLDRRDKVYALLSLRPSVAARIRPDYSITLLELFVRLCEDIFEHGDRYGAIAMLIGYLCLENREVHEVIETFLDADSATSRKFADEERMSILHRTIDEVFLSRVEDEITDYDSDIVSLDVLRTKATEARATLKREGSIGVLPYM